MTNTYTARQNNATNWIIMKAKSSYFNYIFKLYKSQNLFDNDKAQEDQKASVFMLSVAC